MTVVVDASLTMAWCFEDESTVVTEQALRVLAEQSAAVPAIWTLEVANVLLVAERRRRISEAQAARFVALLSQLPIRVEVSAPPLSAVIELARRHGLSAYDAAYLELAARLGAPLGTLDSTLSAAAGRAGVALLVDDPAAD